MRYQQLTRDKRCQIYALVSTGITQKDIAEHIGVSPPTISRELKRNTGQRGYRYMQADRKAIERRHQASCRPKKMLPNLIKMIEEKLVEKWSPEQISGVFGKNDILISHESIYRHIWANKKAGGVLYTHLRRRGKKYNRRGDKTAGRGCIPNRVDIEKRPKIVENKSRLGDWEGDTIIGAKQQGVILSLVDRKSKFTLLAKMKGKYAAQVPDLISKCFKRLPKKVAAHSITFDNGKEFSRHEQITKKTGLNCYFATPYRSWERGLNEHTNGLVRQYCPKGTNLNHYSDEDVQFAEDQLNNRPRKVLGYRTPREVVLGAKRPQRIALQC
jgi:transposase, IS30 family